MAEIWGIVSLGSRFYLKLKAQSGAQKEALLALRWLSKDLSEGSSISFRAYEPPFTTREGIVFGAPKDENGAVAYSDKGLLLWQSVVCYYIDPADRTMYRAQQNLGSPGTAPPIINNTTQSVDVMAGLNNPRTIARNIYQLETVQATENVQVKLWIRDEELGYGLKVQSRLEMKN